MKLRNKKTGEIGNLGHYEDGRIWVWIDNLSKPEYRYNSLAELNAEWEDYEAIGNYFETKEEAEKAVKKLKAWKRLKDKGLEIKGWKFTPDMRHVKGYFVKVEAEIPYIVDNKADLDLIFGGEE